MSVGYRRADLSPVTPRRLLSGSKPTFEWLYYLDSSPLHSSVLQ